MAKDNNQQNTQQNTQVDGDVLAQLAANQATVKDVYILEKGMSVSLNKIVKNQDKTNTVLSDIQKATRTNSKVISSVDSELQNLLRKIDSIVNDVHTMRTNTASTNIPASNSIDNHLTTVIDKLDDISASISGINVTPDLNIDFSDIIDKLDTIIANQTPATDLSEIVSQLNTIIANQAQTTDLSGIISQLDTIITNQATIANGTVGNTVGIDYSTYLVDILQRLDTIINSSVGTNYSTQLDSIIQQLNDLSNSVAGSGSTADYSIQLDNIIQLLNTMSGTTSTATTPDYSIYLNDILQELRNASNTTGSPPTDLADVVSALQHLTTVIDQMGVDIMDATSYVNDCSSYLDEIRELLRNIDDRGESMSTTAANPSLPIAPPDDATKADSLQDINDTLLRILQVIDHIAQDNKNKSEADSKNKAWNSTASFDEIAKFKLIEQLQQSTTDGRMDLQQDSENAIDGLLSNVFGKYDVISESSVKRLTGSLDKWGSGEFVTKDVVGGIGGALGDVAGGAVATAINAVAPGLGSLIGNAIDKSITKASEALGEWLSYFANHARDTRDALIKAALDKIKQDVKDMATYSIDIQRTSLDKIYNAWDQNLSTVNATQGYTKEALNSLQDSVAQRLQREGYGNVINAADYVTQLTNTLNSKLGGELAEAFAAQNLILQKAVPELDLSAMAADFAAIYTNAEKQGRSGEAEMINAMNQIAGATKALEEVTGGNNQFITQVGTFLKKAEEVVIRSGGTTDQIVELTTQMMAAEAPLAALTPQLSGFTNTIIDALMNSNESTAVALRAITHDIDNTIGVSMTDFTKSFMQDTQGTLTAVYQAIDTFINTNANEGARQEFLQAMQSVFGLQASQIAQIDFGDIADQIASASLTTNAKALTAAENLVRSGETTTWEDQLVNNTTNQLLATNAVRDTIDNKLMRKLETNELVMERAVYELESTQTVDFAEKTMAFLTNIADIITGLLDPLGLLSGLTSIADVWNSTEIDKASYELVTTASSIGSTVTTAVDNLNADLRTHANTWGNAQNLAVQAMTKTSTDMMGILSPAAMLAQSITGTGVNQGQAEAAFNILQNSGVTDTFDELMTKHTEATIDAEQAIAEAQAAEMRNQSMELQAQRMQQAAARERQEKAEANQTAFDTRRMEALQQQRAQQAAEAAMVTANHDNIEAIRESVSKLDELSNYLSPILDENRNQSGLLQSLADKVDQLVHTLTNRASQPTVTSPTPNVNTSYNERDRIYGPVKVW